MIPKIIHYCWFGNTKKPRLVRRCIKSWKKYCPDYQIKEWNEFNFDINLSRYVKEAYHAKKYAFVSDYVRLWIIFHYGGIYLDTDVEVIKEKPFVELAKFDSFFGFDSDCYVATGLGFGANKKNDLVKNMLLDYEGIHFIKNDNSYDKTPCPVRNAHVFKEYGFVMNGESQILCRNLLLSREYFCPKDLNGKMASLTSNTIAIHHFAFSWKNKTTLKETIVVILIKIFGRKRIQAIVDFKNKKKDKK